jgi:multicomponent K+:H+ antiporter subunit F
MIGTTLVLAAQQAVEPVERAGALPPVNSFVDFSEVVLRGTIDVGIVAIFIGLLFCLIRLVKGPTMIDRAVASDTLSMQIVGLVLLLTVRFSSTIVFDAVLIVAILGFVSTVAFAQFIGRRGAVT